MGQNASFGLDERVRAGRKERVRETGLVTVRLCYGELCGGCPFDWGWKAAGG